MPTRKYYVYCVVPGCKSSTANTPDKLFFDVPRGNKNLRKKWYEVMKQEHLSPTTCRYCCEDHFTVEEDVEEWFRYKLLKEMGKPVFKLRLKKDVIPHRFDWHPDHPSKTNKDSAAHAGGNKNQKNHFVEHQEVQSEDMEVTEDTSLDCLPEAASNSLHADDTAVNSVFNDTDNSHTSWGSHSIGSTQHSATSSSHISSSDHSYCQAPTSMSTPTSFSSSRTRQPSSQKSFDSLSVSSTTCSLSDPSITSDNASSAHSSSHNLSAPSFSPPSTSSSSNKSTSFPLLTPLTSRCTMTSLHNSNFGPVTPHALDFQRLTSDFQVQVNLRPSYRSKDCQTGVSAASTQERGTSPFRDRELPPEYRSGKVRAECESEEEEEVDIPLISDSSFCLDSSAWAESSGYLNSTEILGSECAEAEDFANQIEKVQFRDLNMKIMEKKSKTYLGLDSHNLYILSLLQKFSGCSKLQVMLVLRKIRLNETNCILEDVFGIDETTVGRYLAECLPKISSLLQTYIFWPKDEVIRSNLPIPFRANYSGVQSIIDCFEVEIEKPSNATHQALTWSEYKKCNTLKYLISCTPDGFINYISPGYGGRASDVEIVKHCGYLDKLKPNVVVMADRGFKQIDNVLRDKNCSLVRPPSVADGSIMTKDDSRQTKVIASLRIHVERVIKRVRDYSLLSAHACYHHSLRNLSDHVAVIACALSNLQSSLIQ